MDKELIINADTNAEVRIALLEDKKLVELHNEKTNSNFSVGDIYLGRIKKLIPGLNAAFIDIGYKKDAFLHYTDLGPNLRSLIKYTNGAMSKGLRSHMLDNFKFEAQIVKTGKINEVLNKRRPILVQVLKEPISTKGPRLSCEVTIPGRHLVLTPFSNTVSVSKKIGNSDERKRLRRLVESIKPKNFGLIVRTAAEGKKVADLHEELLSLLGKWEEIYKQLHRAKPPVKCLSELNKTASLLRDFLSDSFSQIVVDDKELYAEIKEHVKRIAPEKADIVKLHNANKPIFDSYGITRQIKASFGKTATMPSGAYLVIEHTEAMHVVDVNSGHKITSQTQESNALNVNSEAAKEIARQLRLRDIGGIIIIDFIDMRNGENRRKLYQKMKEFMRNDAAKHTILPLSKFGLMQITRQRVRPEVNISTAETCPTCRGTGKVTPSILVTDEIKRDLDFVMESQRPNKLTLTVHPYLHAYLKRGLMSEQMRWFREYKKWVRIKSNNDYGIVQYRLFDENEEEIRLN